MDRKKIIYEFMSDKIYTPMNFKQLCSVLCVPKNEKVNFLSLLTELENDGKIYKNSNNKYTVLSNSNLFKGRFSSTQKGFGFIIDENDEKFFVSPTDRKKALDGDTVLARITKQARNKDKCNECKVVKILSHNPVPIVGKYIRDRNFGFVIADNRAFGTDIFIPKSKNHGAANNSKVTVKITKWPENDKKPEGEILEILGKSGAYDAEIKSILKKFDITDSFPKDVIKQTETLEKDILDIDISDRKDFRDKMIFTIDGDDSKDFDDAVSLEKNSDGYKLGVHIADVTHYVTENSPIDKEALKRGTSVYFPGYVTPMLPEILSNDLCSLKPNCDRLTLSVIIDFDFEGNIKNHEIYESVIRSKYRMTYNKVSAILNGDENTANDYPNTAKILQDMDKLAKTLKKKRIAKGSIDFDIPETKIDVDKNGEITDVYKYHSTSAHALIEEFMLAANKCVAEEMFWCEIPFIYRVHDKPSADKIKTFNKFISFFGYRLKGKPNNIHPKDFSDLLFKIKNTEKELLISKVMLRSLMKACYSEENIGHFGLDFKYYCHFTSPIRRYPDLAIHRIIKEYINCGINENRSPYLSDFVKRAAKSSSKSEIKAMDAERDTDDMMKAKYMERFIGQSFDGVISSVTSFGIFVQTLFGVEGLISMRDLDDDFYEYDDCSMTLIGKKFGKIYSIGDKIRITVKRSDPELREIDYTIWDGEINE